MVRKAEDIEYILNIKNVKNINMRVRKDGKIIVSANKYIPKSVLDSFVVSKREWIKSVSEKLKKRQIPDVDISDKECLEIFSAVSDRIYDIFKNEIGNKPEIKVKKLKSAWGICHPKKGYITLNKALVLKPPKAVEYVIIHEYTHFLYPNHQKDFYKKLSSVMPDYRTYEKILKEEF